MIPAKIGPTIELDPKREEMFGIIVAISRRLG